MRPLRVSFVADTESWGGAEIWLLHHLRRTQAHNVEASVVCAEPVTDRFAPEVPPDRLAVVPLARHAAHAPATAAALRSQQPDIVLVNLVDPRSNAASLAAALQTAPTAATLHLPGDVGIGRARQELASLYADLAVLTTPSQAGATQVRDELATPRGGVVVACNGVDIPRQQNAPADNLVPRVGAYGRLTHQKGFDVLIEATGRLLGRGLRLEVVLGGAGREESRLRAQAAALPIRFTGWVEDSDAFLRGIDMFCLPSRREALPLALLEAMASGLPCVASDVGDIRARVGSAVVLVPPDDPQAFADAVGSLLGDRGRRLELASRAYHCAERTLDAESMVARTYCLLKDVAWSTASR